MFVVSSPNLAVLPNYLHSEYPQVCVKAITEISSLFLLLFFSSKCTHFRNQSKGLERVIFWASKHISFSLSVTQKLQEIWYYSRIATDKIIIFATFYSIITAFSRLLRRKGFPSGLSEGCFLQSVETQHRYLVTNIWCRGDLRTVWLLQQASLYSSDTSSSNANLISLWQGLMIPTWKKISSQ